jgi:hypothetical protein
VRDAAPFSVAVITLVIWSRDDEADAIQGSG